MTLHTAINKTLVILVVTSILSACSFPGVYKIDIPQGNFVTQSQIDQLRPGLTKRQVSFIMGTPLIKDTFNQNRWDYVYGLQMNGGERLQERLSVYFEDGLMASFDGDFTQTPESEQFDQVNQSDSAEP